MVAVDKVKASIFLYSMALLLCLKKDVLTLKRLAYALVGTVLMADAGKNF